MAPPTSTKRASWVILLCSATTINSIIAKQEWKVYTHDKLGRLPLHMVVINLCKDEGTRRTKADEELRKLHNKKSLLLINLVASVYYLPAIHHTDAFSETSLDIVHTESMFQAGRGAGMLASLLYKSRRKSITDAGFDFVPLEANQCLQVPQRKAIVGGKNNDRSLHSYVLLFHGRSRRCY